MEFVALIGIEPGMRRKFFSLNPQARGDWR